MADTKSTSTVGSVRPFKVNYSHVKSDVLKTAQTLTSSFRIRSKGACRSQAPCRGAGRNPSWKSCGILIKTNHGEVICHLSLYPDNVEAMVDYTGRQRYPSTTTVVKRRGPVRGPFCSTALAPEWDLAVELPILAYAFHQDSAHHYRILGILADHS